MRALMFVFRIIFGVTFILSGFFKVIDPVGTGLIVEEYLNIMHLGFLRFGDVALGIVLSITELVVGIAVVLGVRMKVVSWVALIMTVFFTILTFVSALFDLVVECGCFGEAISLTPWQTVIKNIILLICIIPIFLFRKKFKIVAPTLAAWLFLGTYALVAFGFAMYSYFTLPLGDFGDFRAGSNIAEKYDNVSDASNFVTKFAYTKDGDTELFDLDNLPDDSWTYVSSETVYNGDERNMLFDMTLTNADGEIVTESLINAEMPVFIAVVHRPKKISSEYWERLFSAKEMIGRYGGLLYIAAPASHHVLDSLQHQYQFAPQMIYGDYKTLISMVRSNGAVVYLQDGMVVDKWSASQFDSKRVLSIMAQDSEELMARETIFRRLFFESSVLLMLLILILFRFVCGIIYGKKLSSSN